LRHARSGKKLGRDMAHRKALYANLAGAVIEHGRIKTTITKAKAVKPIAEQLITLGRRGDIHARRQAVAFLRSKEIVHKLFSEVGPAFAQRPGGYLRITRIGPRPGDSAEMAYLELVDTPLVFKTRLPAGEPEAEVADEQPEAVEEELDEVSDETPAEEEPVEAEGEEPSAEAEPPAEEDDATTR
jgi:large subunit ribosomal protein L17